MNTPLPSRETKAVRPRGGQIWRRCEDGREVIVRFRRATYPMADVRDHSDLQWSVVSWDLLGSRIGGFAHETDFVREHLFLGEHRNVVESGQEDRS